MLGSWKMTSMIAGLERSSATNSRSRDWQRKGKGFIRRPDPIRPDPQINVLFVCAFFFFSFLLFYMSHAGRSKKMHSADKFVDFVFLE